MYGRDFWSKGSGNNTIARRKLFPRVDKYHDKHEAAKRRLAMHYAQRRRLYKFKSVIYHYRRQQAIAKLKSNPRAYLANKLFWYKVKWEHRYKRKAQGDKFWRFAKDY